MRRRPVPSADEPRDPRAGPAPQARRDHARQRHGAGEPGAPPAERRLSFLHVEMAVIGIITIAGVIMSLQSLWRWVVAMLGL